MRADGIPSGVAVASVTASGYAIPAACASRNHAWNCASGSGARSAFRSGGIEDERTRRGPSVKTVGAGEPG